MKRKIAKTRQNMVFRLKRRSFAFADPNAVSYVDRLVDEEERWHTVGFAGGAAMLLIVHTVGESDGEEVVRIISARKASPGERDLYNSAQ